MCLSTVYVRQAERREQLARNVATVRTRDGKLVFTDIMGVTTEVDAEIETIDLMENYIYIRLRDPDVSA